MMGETKKNVHMVSFQGIEEVEEGYYQIKLSIGNLDWEAGQYGVYTLPGYEIEGKDFRPFSFASIPEEDHILIGTRSIGDMSEFKKTFFSMEKGEDVQVKGPLGHFVLPEDGKGLVFIALGIGITPVRSILKKMDVSHARDAHIIYSSEGYFMFKDEIEDIVKKNDVLSIVYPTSVKETKEEIASAIEKFGQDVYYFVSGPPKAIKSVKEQLQDAGIEKDHMKHDPFTGY